MSKIQVLPPELASQIAAGEVVERPASVVKELLENSLDAGARRIEVAMVAGGLELLEIRDDGLGMSGEEAELALARHATSKLRRMEDLDELGTYGFRGEALPSIASVSKLSLSTRRQEDEAGTELRLKGAEIVSRAPIGMPVGTVIRVKDLFFNVPARKKFLRSTSTEAGHVTEVLEDVSLTRPEVSFLLFRDGRQVRRLSRASSRLDRVEQLLEERLLDISGERGPLHLEAYVTGAERATKGAAGLKLVVNGRVVRDRALSATIAHAYGNSLEKGRYPRGVVYLDLPGRLLDVNVHPQKTEVRFAEPRALTDAVFTLFSRALSQGLRPQAQQASLRANDARSNDARAAEARATEPRAAEAPQSQSPDTAPVPTEAAPETAPASLPPTRNSAPFHSRAPRASQEEDLLSDWPASLSPEPFTPRPSAFPVPWRLRESAERRAAQNTPRPPPVQELPSSYQSLAAEQPLSTPLPTRSDEPATHKEFTTETRAPGGPRTELRPTAAKPEPVRPALSAEAAPASKTSGWLPSELGDTAAAPRLRFLAQLRQTWLVCEGPDGLYVVDQHAASESVIKSRLRADWEKRQVAAQSLLFPLTLEVTHEEARLLEQHQETVKNLGLDVRLRGPKLASLHSAPRLLESMTPERVLRELLIELGSGSSASLAAAIDRSLSKLACHAALRAGDRLNPVEAQALVSALQRVDESQQSAHGRPIVATTTWLELERKVGRR